jgi:hypothetical protein
MEPVAELQLVGLLLVAVIAGVGFTLTVVVAVADVQEPNVAVTE